MWIARDRGGLWVISEGMPIRNTCHWGVPSHRYFKINSEFGEELFPPMTWKDEPKEVKNIEINFKF